MKKLSVATLLLLFSGSCKKKYETCHFSIIYDPVEVAFCGFLPTQLEAVSISEYSPNGKYDLLVKTDTIDFSSAHFSNDTACRNNGYTNFGLVDLQLGLDYRITVIAVNQTFTISAIYQGETSGSFKSERCSPGMGQPHFKTWDFKVNGKNESAPDWGGHHYVFCISK